MRPWQATGQPGTEIAAAEWEGVGWGERCLGPSWCHRRLQPCLLTFPHNQIVEWIPLSRRSPAAWTTKEVGVPTGRGSSPARCHPRGQRVRRNLAELWDSRWMSFVFFCKTTFLPNQMRCELALILHSLRALGLEPGTPLPWFLPVKNGQSSGEDGPPLGQASILCGRAGAGHLRAPPRPAANGLGSGALWW